MEKFFRLRDHGTTVRTEIVAGVTTFFTMAYILFVNPDLLSTGAAIAGQDPVPIANGVFFATCLASFLGTLLMALYAKIPFAQAPGMGLNAFFAFTVMAGYGYLYNQALGVVFISGILFIIITATGLRATIIKSIPANVKASIAAGIGLFLAFLGMQNAGIVTGNNDTLVSLVNFSSISDPEFTPLVMSAIMAIVGLLIIVILAAWKVPGAILVGILATTVLCHIIQGFFGVPINGVLPFRVSFSFGQQFRDFTQVSLLAFGPGLVSLFQGQSFLQALSTVVVLVLSFTMVDMFDTIGTLLGTAKQAGLLKKDGTMDRMNQAMMSDAIATTAGAMLGTSTVTTFVESSAGIGEGGRTGLTSLTTSILFLIAIILAPVIGLVPSAATAPALIYVGCLMISTIRDVNWKDITEAIPAFLTVAMMTMTYSIANGIAFGLISYVIIKLCTGKVKKIHPLCAVLAVLFILRFFLMAM